MAHDTTLDPTSRALAVDEAPNLVEGELDAVELLPEPINASFDSISALEALLVKLKLEDRHNARQENQMEEQRIEAFGQKQIQAILDRADAVLAQGIVSGGMQMLGGGLGAYGGFAEKEGWKELGEVAMGSGELGDAYLGLDTAAAEADQTAAQTAQATSERRADQAASEMKDAQADLRLLLDAIQKIHEAEAAAQGAALFKT